MGDDSVNREEWLEVAVMNAKRGGELPHARLTADAVRQIRAGYRPGNSRYGVQALADRFGVAKRTIEAVIYGQNWVHVR